MNGAAELVTPRGSEASPAALVCDDGPVRIITLNRPRSRNAVDLAMAQAIHQALEEYDARPDLRCAILTATGTVFCAGMDLKAFLRGERPSTTRGFAGLVEQPPRKPLIAAVNGPAVAGGFEIALACDLIVASESATFALPEVKRGLVAAGGGLLRLPGRLPYHLAMEVALTGEPISAATAQSLGLVNRVVPPEQVLASALDLARRIAGNGPLAVTATKSVLLQSPGWPQGEAFDRQRLITEPVRSSRDAREGARAFAEKREPVWLAE